jgi:hypothetical protein
MHYAVARPNPRRGGDQADDRLAILPYPTSGDGQQHRANEHHSHPNCYQLDYLIHHGSGLWICGRMEGCRSL